MDEVPPDFKARFEQAKAETRKPFEILPADQLPSEKPPVVIEGLLRQEEILLMGGQAKRWKSWGRLDMLYCVANGMPWLGFETVKHPVIHVDLEMHAATLRERLELISQSYGKGHCRDIHVIPARGRNFGVLELEDICTYVKKNTYGIFSLDPIYRLLGGKNENDAGVVTELLNRFLNLGFNLKAAICLLQHFAKGDASMKEALDRFSGSGVWGRFPDAGMTFTDLETENCFSVEISPRDFVPIPPFAVRFDFPRFRLDENLDPEKLKQPRMGRPKVSTAEQLAGLIHCDESIGYADLLRRASSLCQMKKRTFDRRLLEAKNSKLIYLSPLNNEYALTSEYLKRNGSNP
jgi:AAA domain